MQTDKCGTYAGWNLHRKNSTDYCQECRSFKLEYDKQYRKNPEKLARIQERDRMRVRNKEERKRTNKSYRERNIEEVRARTRAFNNKRRAWMLNTTCGPYTEEEVLSLYGTLCHICNEKIDLGAKRSTGAEGWEKGLHIDHLIPMSKGGPDTLDNVRPSHGLCNTKKNAKLITQQYAN